MADSPNLLWRVCFHHKLLVLYNFSLALSWVKPLMFVYRAFLYWLIDELGLIQSLPIQQLQGQLLKSTEDTKYCTHNIGWLRGILEISWVRNTWFKSPQVRYVFNCSRPSSIHAVHTGPFSISVARNWFLKHFPPNEEEPPPSFSAFFLPGSCQTASLIIHPVKAASLLFRRNFLFTLRP